MSNLGKIVYLTEAQLATLVSDGSITVGDKTVTYSENDIYMTPNQPVVPPGGTTGQVLAKASASNYDMAWADVYTKAQLDAIMDVTFSDVSTYWTNGVLQSSLKKCGHIVTGKITIMNTDTALPGSAYTDLGKVSAKPVADVSVTLAPVGTSGRRVAIMVTSAGVVRAYNYSTTSSLTGTVLITYITND